MNVEGNILWYRGFYDVPRVFCVVADDAVYVFESRFLDDLDEYDDAYDVKRVVGTDVDPDVVLARAGSEATLARIPVSAVSFDSTRRKSMRVEI